MDNYTDLPKSPVVFDEITHTYRLGDKMLSGITSLIHDVLHLGVYPDANEFVRQVSIPRAGYYGTCVHHSIQTFDQLGIRSTRFPEKMHPTQDYGVQVFGPHDVGEELDRYIKLKDDTHANVMASEYTVSDGKNFASQIDVVWQLDATGEIVLVDHKTNNINYFPCGRQGLKRYLSWQLSIYAVLFERQTGLKVNALGCDWCHRYGDKVESEYWDIERVPNDNVTRLLDNTTVVPHPRGWGFAYTYKGDASELLGNTLPVEAHAKALIGDDIITAIANVLEAEKTAKEMKQKLKEAMIDNGITKWECDKFTATIAKDSVTHSFDKKQLAIEHPEIDLSKYDKTSTKTGSFTIKLK